MEIQLDGTSPSFQTEDRSVPEILDDLDDWLRGNGRAVTAVAAGDREIPIEGWRKAVAEAPPERVDVSTQPLDEVARATAQELAGHLGDVSDRSRQIASGLRGGNVAAYQGLQEILAVWSATVQAAGDIRRLFDGAESPWNGVDTLLEKTADRMRQTRESLERRDNVTLADLMEYEWVPLADDWKAFVEGRAAGASSA